MSNYYQVKNESWEIPPFITHELKAKSNEYAVCIPVINEGDRIRNQLLKMKHLTDLIDIVIADGGSSDNSLDLEFLKAQNVKSLLVKKGEGKLSAQMRMAMGFCIQEGYKGMVFIDGNNKDDTDAIPEFINKLKQGYDHVQGSRYIPGGKAVNTPMARHLGLKILHAPLISLASGFKYSDTTNGFRAYSSKFLSDNRVNPFRNVFPEYELHYYLAIRAPRLGYKTIETPVTRVYPKGKTPTKISPFKGYIKILITLFKASLQLYNPK
ncbi:MAG: glycosyltransferase family 2 protein [Cytophagaceae bacterium]